MLAADTNDANKNERLRKDLYFSPIGISCLELSSKTISLILWTLFDDEQGSRGMGTTEGKPLSPPSAFHAVPSCHKGPLPLQSSESCLLEELAAADDRSLETGGSTPIVRSDMTR